MGEHFRAYSAVFPVILRDEGSQREVLLHKRQNTDYMDGMWDFAGSGHVEAGETATQALVRECLEEIGIVVKPSDAAFAHVCHRVSGTDSRTYYDLYFVITCFSGVPRITEPEKCAALEWFCISNLPKHMIPLRRAALTNVLNGVAYSELAHQPSPPIEYRSLTEGELSRSLFGDFIRTQPVTLCRRRVNGAWVELSDPFVDDWSEADYALLLKCLSATLRSGGVVYGAFVAKKLKGFASVEARPLGPGDIYRDLTSLHVSADVRGQGIGRELFSLAADWARRQGAQKLYLSAHSAVETQAFYRAMGCVDAMWQCAEHVQSEPFDCQLELMLSTDTGGTCE